MSFVSNVFALSWISCLFCLISSQPTSNGVCEAGDLKCSQQGEFEYLRLAHRRLQEHFKDMNTDDCADLYKEGNRKDGVYTIKPKQLLKPIQVYCDMTEDGGGWTKLLRRQDGSVDFNQVWDVYKTGFGNISGEHWLGNDNMAALTRQRLYKLRIRLWDFDGETRYADYANIVVEPEWDLYRLHIGVYSGDAGDSFTYHNGLPFTTKDKDNDSLSSINCAIPHPAGNWFKECYKAGLTNEYSHTPNQEKKWRGIVWNAWHGAYYSLKAVDMKIRPVDF